MAHCVGVADIFEPNSTDQIESRDPRNWVPLIAVADSTRKDEYVETLGIDIVRASDDTTRAA